MKMIYVPAMASLHDSVQQTVEEVEERLHAALAERLCAAAPIQHGLAVAPSQPQDLQGAVTPGDLQGAPPPLGAALAPRRTRAHCNSCLEARWGIPGPVRGVRRPRPRGGAERADLPVRGAGARAQQVGQGRCHAGGAGLAGGVHRGDAASSRRRTRTTTA